MTNSPLVDHVNISPNSTNPRRGKIKKITIHHVAGNLTVERVGEIFKPSSRQASSTYGVDNRGRVGMYVEEKNRAWTSSNAGNDNQAVTIEVANNGGAPNWPVSDVALEKTIELCVDICQRNDIEELVYTGDSTGNLTRHNMFANTVCPGPYLQSRFPYIVQEVNKRLKGEPEPSGDTLWRVQTGAFSNRANADRLETELKSKGYDTYLVKADGLYKVQVGAFGVRANADRMEQRLKRDGYDTYITAKGGEHAGASEPSKTVFKTGDRVKVDKRRRGFQSFVYDRVHEVRQLKNGQALLTFNGAIMGWVETEYLIKQ